MTILQHSIAQAAAAASGYQIARSLRFNRADSAYMSRTLTANGNRQLWTFSGWIKRSGLGTQQTIFATSASSTTDWAQLVINSSDQVEYIEYSTVDTARRITTQVLRDVSAWYHIVCVWDSSNATANNRILLYINGQAVTAFSTTINPSSGASSYINSTSYNPLNIGRLVFSNAGTNHFDGYISNIHFIDGQALTPSSFGETDSATGVWVPKAYTGTFGTNGFWLKFDDNSGTTSTTLGKDSSGNSNNWTPNNFSVTAGVGNDSLVDSPTNYGTDTGAGGEVRGNYCTLNPLAASSSSVSLTNGNLDVSIPSNVAGAMGTTAVTSGKWYWEFTAGTASQNAYYVSVADTAVWFPVGNTQNNMYLSAGVYTYYGSTGEKINNGSVSAYGATFTSGDVIGVALDMDNGAVYFSKNGTWQNSGVPTSGASKTGAAFTTLSGKTIIPWIGNGASTTSSAGTVNFGQRPFAYTAPSGFKALCTQNLPTPAIGASASTLASKNFNVVTYTGDGSSSRNITGVGFAPDFVWFKNRASASFGHRLYDIIRGATKELYSHSTAAEFTETTGLTAFGSDGYTVGSQGGVNENGSGLVTWNWKANGAGVSNTAGSITSTVSANTAAGISVVTWTGNGVNNATIGHGLGVAPKLVITKRRDAVQDWVVYTPIFTALTTALAFNSTSAQFTATAGHVGAFGANTLTLTQGSSSIVNLNTTSSTYLAYVFAEVAGFSKIGTYTGNASADGPFVYCGFRPRFVMMKRTDSTSDWLMLDAARGTVNVVQPAVLANSSIAEITSTYADFLSNGFKLRDASTGLNVSGGTYIFMAFAEFPFQYARAR